MQMHVHTMERSFLNKLGTYMWHKNRMLKHTSMHHQILFKYIAKYIHQIEIRVKFKGGLNSRAGKMNVNMVIVSHLIFFIHTVYKAKQNIIIVSLAEGAIYLFKTNLA